LHSKDCPSDVYKDTQFTADSTISKYTGIKAGPTGLCFKTKATACLKAKYWGLTDSLLLKE